MDIETALSGVIGQYTPVAITEQVLASDNTVITLTQYVPDYNWFGSLAVLLVALFCFFRAVGGMLKCKI